MGGSLQIAACGFAQDGARLEKCYPSFNAVEGDSGKASVCPSSSCCTTNPVFKIKSGSAHLIISGQPTDLRSVPTEDQEKATWELIKRDIYSNGPLPTTIVEWVSSQGLDKYWNSSLSVEFDDLPVFDPRSGISYLQNQIGQAERGSPPSGHALVITGWGRQGGQDYWEIRNSWGDQVGGGYFKYAMVHNDPCCLAVPRTIGNSTSMQMIVGGAWTFQPEEFPDGYTPSKPSGKRGGSPGYDPPHDHPNTSAFKNFFSFTKDGKPNWVLIIIIAIVAILLTVLVITLLTPHKKVILYTLYEIYSAPEARDPLSLGSIHS